MFGCLNFLPERFAERHCSVLLDSSGPFASCHPIVDPRPYHEVCEGLTLINFGGKYFDNTKRSMQILKIFKKLTIDCRLRYMFKFNIGFH